MGDIRCGTLCAFSALTARLFQYSDLAKRKPTAMSTSPPIVAPTPMPAFAPEDRESFEGSLVASGKVDPPSVNPADLVTTRAVVDVATETDVTNNVSEEDPTEDVSVEE